MSSRARPFSTTRSTPISGKAAAASEGLRVARIPSFTARSACGMASEVGVVGVGHGRSQERDLAGEVLERRLGLFPLQAGSRGATSRRWRACLSDVSACVCRARIAPRSQTGQEKLRPKEYPASTGRGRRCGGASQPATPGPSRPRAGFAPWR
jgi:hypothetical protein